MALSLTGFAPGGLVRRILPLALLFTAELLLLSLALDGDSIPERAGLLGIVHRFGAWILRGLIGFVAVFITFSYLRAKPVLDRVSSAAANAPLRWSLLAAHGGAIAIFARLSAILYGGSSRSDPLALAWFLTGISAIAFGALAFLPWALWLQWARGTGYLWAYAAAAVTAGCFAGNLSRALWSPASQLTFHLVQVLLRPFVSDVIANPGALTVGTRRFFVILSPECSGLEGAGLILAFGIVWLLLFRHECRFPHSLLLLPAGVALIFFLNAVRLVGLVLIGNAGARQIAAGGFHSQAGWILFNTVAVFFCVAVRRVPWFAAAPPAPSPAVQNPAAAYLMPFLAIVGAGMVAGAAAGNFEWLYPLRFFAAAAVLSYYRRSYSRLNWRFDGHALATGAVVFLLWIGLDHLLNRMPSAGVPAALAAASPSVRWLWLCLRVLSAVAIVPIAEELAFRGFLLRRLVSPDFEALAFARVTAPALLLSSVGFGVLHSGHRVAGVLAGILFAWAAMRRGRIGDAVTAHAAANALLATYVLAFGAWHLW